MLTAALKVIVDHGVKGVTHRRVAAAAEISLSSTNYHFANLDELMLAAFKHFAGSIDAKYTAYFESANTDKEIAEAILALVKAQRDDRTDAVLLYELIAQAVRDPRYRAFLGSWSRQAKARLVDLYGPQKATRLEAVWEGLTIQRFVGDTTLSDKQAHAFIMQVLAAKA